MPTAHGNNDSGHAEQMPSPEGMVGGEGNRGADMDALASSFRVRMAALTNAASPAPSAATASQQASVRGTPGGRIMFVNDAAPTPTQHVSDQQHIQLLERKWRSLSQGMRTNSQAAADVLMKQAQATSQIEEMLQLMFIQLKSVSDDRARLQQQLLHERAAAAVQADELAALQQRLQLSEGRNATVHVVADSLQGQLAQARDALEASQSENEQLKAQVGELEEQLAVTSECRTRGDTIMAEQAAVLEALRQQLEDRASMAAVLAEDKAALEAQLQGVLQAEQELTVHLRETHTAIEGQLGTLREQLKTERQKRAAVVKRRGELQVQVELLQAQVVSQHAEMAALIDRQGRAGGGGHHVSAGEVPAHGMAKKAALAFTTAWRICRV
ncbi:hypothetical protein HXX76_006482 [Chlamydomonas incerta]|uniref:Uncharacterized protein n=1 Tax=Chlamydomonas incerta TaxID=51695 RepID=A0A835T4P1_CHLIN|nr:hypothetical protein HXX76_006482 [Chlamydomonas incerta]|eukprot:KAG2436967.1 hypothetical protein HXX76_006482 [Chlamydomonas incerta]